MDPNDRGLVKFTSLAHALFHTYELSIPLFVGLWISEFGTSAAIIGIVVGIGYAFIGIGAPVSGVLADRLSSRRLIVISVLGMGIGFGTLALAQGILSLGLAVLFWGAFASIYHPAGLSLISRTAEQRGTVFAYHGAGGNVGTAIGPLTTAVLLMFAGWRLTAALLAAVAVAVAVVGGRVDFVSGVSSGTDGDSALTELRRMPGEIRTLFGLAFTLAFVAILLYGTYYRGLLTFLPEILAESPTLQPIELLGEEINPAQYVYTSLLTIGIAGQYAGGRLTDRVRSTTAFIWFLGILAGLALLFPYVRTGSAVTFVGVCLLLGFFVYGTAPIYQVVIAERAHDDVQGLSYGFTYLAMFGIGAAGASVAGLVLTHATSGALFAVLAAIAGAGVLSVGVLRRL